MPTDTPWLVAAVQQNYGTRCITYEIFARFAEAITSGWSLAGSPVAEPGSELESQIEDWIESGAPLQNVPATDIFAGLPGGFEVTRSSEFVSLRASGPPRGGFGDHDCPAGSRRKPSRKPRLRY